VTGHVVLVTGPPCAGLTSVVAALGERMSELAVVESVARGETPDSVVLAVSASAPMTASDCAYLDGPLADVIGPVVAVVTKVDAHRRWRDVLAADRAVLAAHRLDYRDVPWMGIAAAPELGEPDVEQLVASLRRGFADVAAIRRRRVCRLQDRRRRIVAEHRRERSTHALTARGAAAQARVSLTHWVRDRCARMVVDLRAEVATLSRSQAPTFENRVREVVAVVGVELEMRIERELDMLAGLVGTTPPAASQAEREVDVSQPVLSSRRVENQLMVVLGAGFGLGVALASGRLLSSVAEGLDVMGPVLGALLGLAVTVWVVGVRGLLHTRAALDRWVVEAGAAARFSGEARVAARLLAAEAALATASAEREQISAAQTAMLIAAIDAEIGVIMQGGTSESELPAD
jgi:hypothetical protein